MPKLSITKSFYIALSLSICGNISNVNAQEHIIHWPYRDLLQHTAAQYNEGHYHTAIQSAEKYLSLKEKNIYDNTLENRLTAKYYKTLSHIKIKSFGAADSAKLFLKETTHPTQRQRIAFALAQYYFEKNEFANAIIYYQQIDLNNLNNDEIAEFKFETAYSYFINKQFDKAYPLFETVKAIPGKYNLPANYYYGLLAYNKGKYKEALESFKKVDGDIRYKHIVSFYEAEIYYFTGKSEEALDLAMQLTKEKDKSYYDNELHLLTAQILFEDKRYGDALPYFEHYYRNVDKIRKEELYEMAYSYYQVNEWKNAIEKFKPLSNIQDSLGQTAMYLLGDAYLKTGNKKNARNAFAICASMPFNQHQQEASLLVHSKLSYEMHYYDEALLSIQTLFNQFPQSAYAAEAKTLLSGLLARTHNYKEAFQSLQDVEDYTTSYNELYQKIAYGYAAQEMQKDNLLYADSLLSLSLSKPINHDYTKAAYFWKGDIAHQLGNYQDAYNYSKKFMESAGNATYISKAANKPNALINLGYAAMQLNDYAAAQEYFNSAKEETISDERLLQTINLREADALFMQKKYDAALALYQNISQSSSHEAAYAILQIATIEGVKGNTSKKITLLKELLKQNPSSAYNAKTRYELGITYIEEESYNAAVQTFKPLLDADKGKEFTLPSWIKIGFSYQQLGRNKDAIQSYLHVVENYPNASEKHTAVEALRNLYIETNQPDKFAVLLKEHQIDNTNNQSLDSTYYATAEAQIAANNWDAAEKALVVYLEKYPQGLFTTRAHYYLAESHHHLKNYPEALKHYDYVLSLPWNEFSENSALQASIIAERNKDYAKAAGYYAQLRNSAMSKENLEYAYTGLMRASARENNFELAATYIDTLQSFAEIDKTLKDEGSFYHAKALQKKNELDKALPIYEGLKTTPNKKIADEVNYRIAEIYFLKNDITRAEKQAATHIKEASGDVYWTVKSYLLLADILTLQKDYFNAKATLQSILKNAQFEDLKKEADEKLKKVKLLEQEQSKLLTE